MKQSDLQTALTKRIKSTSDLADLKELDAETSSRLAEMCAVLSIGDLKDKKRIAEVGELQIVKALLPTCIAAREAADLEHEPALQRACESFVAESLGPRIRKLAEQARTKARQSLAPHLKNSVLLESAVEDSEIVHEISGLASAGSIVHVHDGATDYAQRLLAIPERLDALEAKLA
jgi:hypothetical protein